jgi:hypothetical protein
MSAIFLLPTCRTVYFHLGGVSRYQRFEAKSKQTKVGRGCGQADSVIMIYSFACVLNTSQVSNAARHRMGGCGKTCIQGRTVSRHQDESLYAFIAVYE